MSDGVSAGQADILVAAGRAQTARVVARAVRERAGAHPVIARTRDAVRSVMIRRQVIAVIVAEDLGAGCVDLLAEFIAARDVPALFVAELPSAEAINRIHLLDGEVVCVAWGYDENVTRFALRAMARRAPDHGQRYLALARTLAESAGCSPREARVLERVALGDTRTQIGSAMQRSENTVKHHLKSISKKTGLSGVVEIREWLREQLVTAELRAHSSTGRWSAGRTGTPAGPIGT